MSNGKDNAGKMLLTAGVAGGTAAIVARLLAPKPVEAAPLEERWEDLLQSQAAIILLLEQLSTAIGEIQVTVSAPWVAKDPEQIYSHAIRVVGTFFSDKMVDFTRGKRLVFIVQSSLNQATNIQLLGNYVDDFNRATTVGAVWPCPANSSISIRLAYDDWMPFVGVRMTTAVAPAAGILNVWSVIQE